MRVDRDRTEPSQVSISARVINTDLQRKAIIRSDLREVCFIETETLQR